MRPLLLVLALLLAASPTLAHGAAEANELEVEVLRDEENDLPNARGGWDVAQVFVGEAHAPSLGAREAGDTLYWRADLYGAPGTNPLVSGAWRAVFTFETADGPLERTLSTKDGKTFDTDFDLLQAETEDGVLRIERAHILLGPAGLAPGATVSGFRVATFVDDEPRDRAPGGIPLAGPVETPDEGEVVTADHTLTGPTRYATATLGAADGKPALIVTSLLQKGSQHVELALPKGLTTPDPLSVNVKPNGVATFRLDVASDAPTRLDLDVLTDVGGRASLTLERDGDTLRVAGEDDAGADDAPRRVPSAGVALALVAVGLALVVARRR